VIRTIQINQYEAADRLGVNVDSIGSVIRREWLPNRRRRPARPQISLHTLTAFVAEPRAWLLVAPRDILDPDLRAAAMAAWQAAGEPRWWSAHDLAHACHITTSTVGWRRRNGWGTTWERWGPWWWHLGTEPPAWQPSRTTGHVYIAMRDELGSMAAVARATGKSYAAVMSAARRAAQQEVRHV